MSALRPVVTLGTDGRSRCSWGADDEEYRRYHDEEWGYALHGDRPLFEKLSLEGFQAGLSWITILRRRPTFRAAFHDFDIERVSAIDGAEIERLMLDPGIIRNRAKILATIQNARLTREIVRGNPGAFNDLLWQFAPEAGSRARPLQAGDVPAISPESTALSLELRRRGYSFVGPTTLYALMQSSGMVDDHFEGCWRASSTAKPR